MSIVNASELDRWELAELLQKSAVENLTTFRRLQLQQFGSVAAIITTDFESSYAYKHGEYQRCLQCCLHRTCAHCCMEIMYVPLHIQTRSLFSYLTTTLYHCITFIVDPKRLQAGNVFISQLTLSLYLMTQCQLKLRTLLSNVTGSDIRLHRSRWKKKIQLTGRLITWHWSWQNVNLWSTCRRTCSIDLCR